MKHMLILFFVFFTTSCYVDKDEHYICLNTIKESLIEQQPVGKIKRTELLLLKHGFRSDIITYIETDVVKIRFEREFNVVPIGIQVSIKKYDMECLYSNIYSGKVQNRKYIMRYLSGDGFSGRIDYQRMPK